ncbi:hypothetical protein M407DRAFT_21196 [Tulasnella calospora MUT 4182]|uniref:Extracellular membrane protein CFEM domain-containing protein n=1 Tax=Tulasnella calospora MUT 4182 TaxID=1051891 RepID=A0A0C3QQ58_9AGAM|nr:hypothetical protein M407DRAFT_21196 [Tulasnella calospora MUT 4182]
MRCLAFLSLILVAPVRSLTNLNPFLTPAIDETAFASPLSPPAVSSGTEILRRQATTGDACTNQCDAIQTKVDACGKNASCFCTAAIANEMESCASCKLEADPSSAPALQTFLNQYVNGCQANGHAVGSLTLTGSVASALPTATQSSSSRPAAATPTSSSTRSGNSASVVGVRPISALIAASVTVAFGFL